MTDSGQWPKAPTSDHHILGYRNVYADGSQGEQQRLEDLTAVFDPASRRNMTMLGSVSKSVTAIR